MMLPMLNAKMNDLTSKFDSMPDGTMHTRFFEPYPSPHALQYPNKINIPSYLTSRKNVSALSLVTKLARTNASHRHSTHVTDSRSLIQLESSLGSRRDHLPDDDRLLEILKSLPLMETWPTRPFIHLKSSFVVDSFSLELASCSA